MQSWLWSKGKKTNIGKCVVRQNWQCFVVVASVSMRQRPPQALKHKVCVPLDYWDLLSVTLVHMYAPAWEMQQCQPCASSKPHAFCCVDGPLCSYRHSPFSHIKKRQKPPLSSGQGFLIVIHRPRACMDYCLG